MSRNPRQQLSVCMIVKNEAEFLEECLKSVQPVADEIRILDTGSTDETIEIAKRYGAIVELFHWVDDFSAARNASIKHAQGDWILWLDADERLQKESVQQLQKLLKKETGTVVYKVSIYNLMKDRDNFYISSAHRLFTNHRGIVFSGRIHEQISPAAAKLKAEERNCDVRLTHLGYGLEEQAQNKKNKRNRKLLEQFVRESPGSGYAHYTFAQHLIQTGELAMALKHYETALKLDQFDQEMKVSLMNTMGDAYLQATDFERAMSFARQSVQLNENQVAGYYLQYKILNLQEKFDEAIPALRKLIDKNKTQRLAGKSISTDIVIREDRLHYTLGNLLLRTGKFNEALAEFKRVYLQDSENPEVLWSMAQCYVQLANLQQAEKCLVKLSVLKEHDFKVLDLLALVQLKLQKFQLAAVNYETMLKLQPHNQHVVKRLAGLYVKTGNIRRAEALLMRGNSGMSN